MVERMARVIDPEAWVEPASMQMLANQNPGLAGMLANSPPEMDRTERQRRRDASLGLARRIIAAMREPTEAMLKAAKTEGPDDDVWRAMIDAALKP